MCPHVWKKTGYVASFMISAARRIFHFAQAAICLAYEYHPNPPWFFRMVVPHAVCHPVMESADKQVYIYHNIWDNNIS